MGFDDCVFDSDIEQKTLELCREFYTYYSPLNLMLDEEWLTSAENEKQYNGYSLAFHLLYTISYTILVGRCIDNASQKEIDCVKKKTRIKIMKDMIEFYSNNGVVFCGDDFNDGGFGEIKGEEQIGEQIDALILYVYKYKHDLN
tara:strand:+ start:2566 stop:2997 length:432 start_codon:yes stop_codon:yes gene_type:complete